MDGRVCPRSKTASNHSGRKSFRWSGFSISWPFYCQALRGARFLQRFVTAAGLSLRLPFKETDESIECVTVIKAIDRSTFSVFSCCRSLSDVWFWFFWEKKIKWNNMEHKHNEELKAIPPNRTTLSSLVQWIYLMLFFKRTACFKVVFNSS